MLSCSSQKSKKCDIWFSQAALSVLNIEFLLTILKSWKYFKDSSLLPSPSPSFQIPDMKELKLETSWIKPYRLCISKFSSDSTIRLELEYIGWSKPTSANPPPRTIYPFTYTCDRVSSRPTASWVIWAENKGWKRPSTWVKESIMNHPIKKWLIPKMVGPYPWCESFAYLAVSRNFYKNENKHTQMQ